MLPTFKYYKNPYDKGFFKEENKKCSCCGNVSKYIYEGTFYSSSDLELSLCPWCINSGKAASKYKLSFIDIDDIKENINDKNILDEIEYRTPSYPSWQETQWVSHCNDACKFIREATKEDISNASQSTKDIWKKEQDDPNLTLWNELSESFLKSDGISDVSFFIFECIHCKTAIIRWELS